MQEFLEFIASVFEVEPHEINEDTSYGEFAKWDSLMHLRIIMEVEDRYEVEIPIDDVPNIKTLKDLYAHIKF